MEHNVFIVVCMATAIYIHMPNDHNNISRNGGGDSNEWKSLPCPNSWNDLDGCIQIRKSTQRCIEFSIHRALNTTEFCMPYLLPKCTPDAHDQSQIEVVVLEKFTSDPFPDWVQYRHQLPNGTLKWFKCCRLIQTLLCNSKCNCNYDTYIS